MHRRFAPLFVLALAAVGSPAAGAAHATESRAERLAHAQVVVVRGSADHMETVLRHAQLRFVEVDPAELAQIPLNGQQVLMVNCTGELPPAARERVRRFVTAGGFLYTTDHAVHYLLERIFPGFIRYNGQTSEEQIFPMQVGDGDRGLLAKIDGSGHPRWQLAGGGYLFDVIDKQRVDVLMSSRAVAKQFHNSGVLGVRFHVGDGQVIHVTGHFYTQPGQAPEVASAGRAFEQLSANVVSSKIADKPRLDRLYDVAPRGTVTLQSAPNAGAAAVSDASGRGGVSTAPSTPVRVLDEKDGYKKVRDVQGNEGWVPSSAL